MTQAEPTTREKAQMLIDAVTNAIASGTRHYRKSDGALLPTTRDVIEALAAEGEIIFDTNRQ